MLHLICIQYFFFLLFWFCRPRRSLATSTNPFHRSRLHKMEYLFIFIIKIIGIEKLCNFIILSYYYLLVPILIEHATVNSFSISFNSICTVLMTN